MIPSKRFVIERHVLRAIRNTPKGEKITISAYSLDRQVFADELIRARKRGVKVRVLLNDHLVPGAQVRIQRVLGHNTKKKNPQAVHGRLPGRRERVQQPAQQVLPVPAAPARTATSSCSAPYNMTLNAVRWQWNDLWTTVGKTTLYDQFNRPVQRHASRLGQASGHPTGSARAGLNCPSGDQQKYYNTVFPRYTTPSNDAVLDILNNVQCVYTDAAGAQRRTQLRAVDALDARQARQLHRRQAARPVCAGLQPAGQLRPDGLPHQTAHRRPDRPLLRFAAVHRVQPQGRRSDR